jgi:hypothetical protein
VLVSRIVQHAAELGIASPRSPRTGPQPVAPAGLDLISAFEAGGLIADLAVPVKTRCDLFSASQWPARENEGAYSLRLCLWEEQNPGGRVRRPGVRLVKNAVKQEDR